ncbi:MAG: DUF192 domain-containing protein [Candidatus Aceula meridiana]|nr:DUF192 domain-containing protein [Candidatus Aceula meridiana]
MKIINLTQKNILSDSALSADGFFARAKGLLGKKNLDKGEALVISHCQSIHMFFMQFAIDAVFVSRDNVVVGLCKNIKPFRLSPIFLKASFAIELPSGVVNSTQTHLGDKISIEE